MQADRLERPATTDDITLLAHAGHLNPAGMERASALIGQTASSSTWARFVNRGLLAVGVVLSLAGVFFLCAYNWDNIPHLVKLGMVAAALLALVAVSSWRGLETLVGRAALLGAATLVGALFAVFGQAYQTGADSFQLFLTWAILIIPWVIIGRWAPLWLLLLTLLNLSLWFFWDQRLIYDGTGLFIALGLLNIVWLCSWEYGANMGIRWMQQRWFPQIIGTATFGLLLIPTVSWIIDEFSLHDSVSQLGAALYAAFCILVTVYYRRTRDLYMLSVCALSLVIVVTAGGLRLLQDQLGSNRWLVLSLVVVVTTSIAVALLRRTVRSWEGATT